jgi:uroporphyrin-3 C-methyltransferase
VSDDNTLKTQAQPVSPAPEAKLPSDRPRSGFAAVLLASLALLVAAIAVATGGWSAWQLREVQVAREQQATELQTTRHQAAALLQHAEKLDQRLDQLPSAQVLEERRRLLAQLQNDQQLLNQRLETVLGASRQDWRLSEAEHLLRLASLRLSALQDINSATALVKGADDILREQDDPAAFAAREQLAKSLAALRAVDTPDRTGLFLQIGALREQGAALSALHPKFIADGGVLGDWAAESTPGSWWERSLRAAAQYFRLDFAADQQVRPLLAGQSLAQVRLSLSLALEQAQWAALHGYSAVYRQALLQASEVLSGNFNRDDPASRVILKRIAELQAQPIEVEVPQLEQSLSAVQAYIEQKLSARERAKGGAEFQP